MANKENTKNKGLSGEVEPKKAKLYEITAPYWRGALSAGNPSYRRNGDYWVARSSRRIRRILERAAKKAEARYG